jgi:hypothetical protein
MRWISNIAGSGAKIGFLAMCGLIKGVGPVWEESKSKKEEDLCKKGGDSSGEEEERRRKQWLASLQTATCSCTMV